MEADERLCQGEGVEVRDFVGLKGRLGATWSEVACPTVESSYLGDLAREVSRLGLVVKALGW